MFYYSSMYENIGVKPRTYDMNRSFQDTAIKKNALSKISAYFDERSFFQPNPSDDDTASENEGPQ